MRHLLTIWLGLIIAAVSIFGGGDARAADAPALEKVSLQLQWKHQFEFAGFYAAKEKGFYAEAGLDVDLIEFQDGTTPLDNVLNGSVPYAVGYSSLIAEYLKGKPIVLLANFLKRSPIAIVAQPEITTPKDLVGKTVMGVGDTISDMSLLMMLDTFGVAPDSMRFVPPTYTVEPFLNDSVDAMVVFVTNELYQIEKAGKKYTLFNPSVYGAEYYDVNLYTSRAELDANPERARRLRDASIKGWEYALQHPDEIIGIIRDKYNTQNKSVEALKFEARQIANTVMAEVEPVGSIDPQRLKMIAGDLIHLGLLPKDASLNFDDFLFHGDTGPIEFTAAERAFIRATRVRAATTTNWPPFAFTDEGSLRPQGIGYDFWREITKTAGLKTEVTAFTSFLDELNTVRDRTQDVIYSAGITRDRQAYALFSDPYASFPLAIATSKDENFIPDATHLEGKIVAVGRNFTAHKMLAAAFPQLTLLPTDNAREALQAVSDGRAYAFVDIMPALAHAISQHGFTNIKISGETGLIFDLRIMVRDDYPELVSIANKVIAAIPLETRQTILNRWINVQYQQGFDVARYLPYALAALILATLVFLWMYRSKRTAERAEHALLIKSSALERANADLHLAMERLERSNADLQSFAYVASHDLREPLRMISSYLELLRRKYETHLDGEGQEFIGYAVEGAQRMDALIKALLQYSRVQTQDESFASVEAKDVLVEVLDNLKPAIEEVGAVVTVNDLPRVKADRALLLQLFQNLIANALKYRAPDVVPEIDVSAEAVNGVVTFRVRDNGIGIDDRFFEKIFIIFQRLHAREKYSGTGIGLAVCKKIVDHHGGKIWVESAPGHGSTFLFTLSRAAD